MRKAPVRCFSVPLIAWMAASAATLPVKIYTTADGLAEPFRGEEIARFIGLRSPKTLRRHFREELDRAATEANAQVAQSLPRSQSLRAWALRALHFHAGRTEICDATDHDGRLKSVIPCAEGAGHSVHFCPVQKISLICTHMLRMPLSVKSRLRNPPVRKFNAPAIQPT